MAKGGGGAGKGAKGKGGGGGKPTQRSQNYLRRFGYPSARELRREAQGLASASVPTIRSVSQPYKRQMQSTRDFLQAVNAALAETSSQVGAGYDQAIQQSQGVDQAAQTRLASLGLGTDAAGVQAATGARGDAATQNLISNAAAAKNYAAQLPAVAAGSASRQNAGLQKNLLDALSNRRDSLSQAFFQALSQVQGMEMQKAGMVQSGQQFQQQMAQQNSQFAQTMGLQEQQFAFQKQQASRANRIQNAELMAKYGYDTKTGKFVGGNSQQTLDAIAKKYGYTVPEAQHLVDHTYDQTSDLLKKGTPWKEAIRIAEGHGVPPPLARLAVMSAYSNPEPPPSQVESIGQPPDPSLYKQGKNDPNYKGDYQSWLTKRTVYKQHYATWKAAVGGFNQHVFLTLARQAQKQFDSIMHPPSGPDMIG